LLERIFILEDDNLVAARHLPDRIMRTVRAGAQRPPAIPVLPPDARFHDATEAFQRSLIERALQQNQGNLQRTAAALDLSRHALRHQMIKLGLTKA
jgi:DNA-binding NtrC family response regulator